jgi:hypothetical protein
MVSNELIAALMVTASTLSGLPALEVADYPSVQTLTVEQLTKSQCPDDVNACRSMVAFYEQAKNTILIRNDLNMEKTLRDSFLLHEMVHVLQYKNSGADIFKDCQSTINTERMAYGVQNNYLIDQGVFQRFGDSLTFMTCSDAQDIDSDHVTFVPVPMK